LKQQVIGKVTREDHNELANMMIRLYADSKKARERQAMGFKLSRWDEKLLRYSILFEERMMNLQVNMTLEAALDLGWLTLAEIFKLEEVGIKKEIADKYWPKEVSSDR
jgi:V/A-type H+-transporting ATPase subunit B